MKRILVLVIGLAFVLSTVAFAAETVPMAPKKEKAPAVAPEAAVTGKAAEKGAAGAAKAEPVAKAAKKTKMTATGKVMEISDTMLKIERTVKGKMETMEIVLEKAHPKIKVGDKVKVTYMTKDDKNVAVKVVSKAAKKSVKKAKKMEGAAPAAKEEGAAPAAK